MKTEIIAVITKEEEIREITELKELEETFSKFELVKSIELRENEKKQKYYSLNYELQDGTYIIISILLEGCPMIINGFHVNRNYKQFEKSLRKNYSNKII